MQQIGYILLGAIFTSLSLWSIEGWKIKKSRKEKRQNFVLFVKQELASFSKSVERLRSIFEQKNWFDLLTIGQLEKNLQNLESQRKDAIFFDSQKLQEELADILINGSNVLTGIKFLEDNYLEKIRENSESEPLEASNFLHTFNQKRTLKLIDIIEVQRKIDEYLKNL